MKRKEQNIGNERLRNERLLRGWTQEEVARRVDTDGYTVNRWERGRTIPSPYFRQKLCILFGKNADELGFLEKENNEDAEALTGPWPRVWSVPYRRNIYFVGREETIEQLHTSFRKTHLIALAQSQAITGLGGIGKTQTALEYVFRYASRYQTVLWIPADSYSVLLASFTRLASVLDLPEKSEQNPRLVVAAVKNWLETHTQWLLIYDNVEDAQVVSDFFPDLQNGHILLTTRLGSIGDVAGSVEVRKMTAEEGMLFLLRRSKLLGLASSLSRALPDDLEQARKLWQALDGLPLALDQAAAYIEETECGLAGYLERYKLQQRRLLQRRGEAADHPASVMTTWSLSFEKLQRSNTSAVALLQACAFLYPDAIIEEIFTTGACDLGLDSASQAIDVFHLDGLISELRKFSLVRRHPKTNMLSMHRLLQAVLLDWMDECTQQKLVEQLLRVLNQLFPAEEFTDWERCQRCLPHVLACARHLERWPSADPEVADVLNKAGEYLQDQAQYAQAELLYRQALAIRRKLHGAAHPDIGTSLDNLATIHELQWKCVEAGDLYQQALSVIEQTLGPEHPEVAASLNNLGLFYHKLGKYAQAEPLHQRALAIWERAHGPKHTNVAAGLMNLACLYYSLGDYAQAEHLHKQALAIREELLAPDHLLVASSLRNLSCIYRVQGKYDLAESLQLRALSIREQMCGLHHPLVAASLKDLAAIYQDQERFDLVAPLQQRALVIRERAFGPHHPYVADILNEIALHLSVLPQRLDEAELLFLRALTIWKQTLGPNHPDVADCLNGLAELYCRQGKYEQAEQCGTQALHIRQGLLKPGHPSIAQSFYTLAEIYRETRMCEQRAESLYHQAMAIWEEAIGPLFPKIIDCLRSLAELYNTQGENLQAERTSLRALSLCTLVYGPEHLKTRTYHQYYSSIQREVTASDRAGA